MINKSIEKMLDKKEIQTKAVVVAGLAGGSGKSVVSVGLTALMRQRGKNVVPFKKGPDYIDAGWLALAAGKECYNLDPYLMDNEVIKGSFQQHSYGADIAVIEGNRGLYDGVNADGGFSTAELAITLGLPVILVVNCTKTTRTVAAMVLGCRELDPRLNICGVVLNQIATERQSKIITEAIATATNLPVLGVVPRMKRDIFPMRHLGMVPHQEYTGSNDALSFLAETMAVALDIESLEEKMEPILFNEDHIKRSEPFVKTEKKVRIGVIQDAAFQFYYAENLNALKSEGAEIVSINALTDSSLPEIDGLYIGGGFPETSAAELSKNRGFRESIKQEASEGLPIYAECGGLIYLGESIRIDEVEYPLSGIFPARFGMSTKPQAHGYSIFEVVEDTPYYKLGEQVKGHEFRYSTVLEWRGEEKDLALRMKRGTGFVNGRDGLRYKNVLALYTHIHSGGSPGWARDFVATCRKRCWKD